MGRWFRFIDEKFSSLLFSISRVQSPLNLNSSHLKHNSLDLTLHVNDTRLQIDKDAIPSTSVSEYYAPCESNVTVPTCFKGRCQDKCPLICEIETNHKDDVVCRNVSINKTYKDDSKIHDFQRLTHFIAMTQIVIFFDCVSISNSPSSSITPSKSKPMYLTKPSPSSILETKPHVKTSTLDDVSETSALKPTSKKVPLYNARVSKVNLILIVASLVSNESSHLNLMPQRRHQSALSNEAACISFKHFDEFI